MLYLNIYKAHTMQLQEEPFHFLIKSLNMLKFLADFIWQGVLFQIFRPKPSKLLVPKATCFFLGIFNPSLYCCLTGLEPNLSSKISFIKIGFKLFRVLYISMQSLCFLLTSMENFPDFS